MEGPPLGPGGEDITWPDQVAPRCRKASSTRKIKPQTSNPYRFYRSYTPYSGTILVGEQWCNWLKPPHRTTTLHAHSTGCC